jgi:hypothetical protein
MITTKTSKECGDSKLFEVVPTNEKCEFYGIPFFTVKHTFYLLGVIGAFISYKLFVKYGK